MKQSRIQLNTLAGSRVGIVCNERHQQHRTHFFDREREVEYGGEGGACEDEGRVALVGALILGDGDKSELRGG